MTKQTPAACPFCGGRAMTHRHPVRCWAVSCTQCDCKPTTTIRSTEAEAITAWNTRHAPKEHKAADGQGSVAEPQRELGGRSPERRSQEEAGSTPAGGATRPAPEPCGDGLHNALAEARSTLFYIFETTDDEQTSRAAKKAFDIADAALDAALKTTPTPGEDATK